VTAAAVAGLAEVRVDGALHWVLDAPARKNAVTPEALAFIADRARSLRGEVVVLRGEGDGFCAGFDLTALREPTPGPPDRPLAAATAAMAVADATFIAWLHGHVIGAGVELAASCDLRVAATSAHFCVPAARLGVVYHAEGLARIRAAFGPALTRRLLLLGETIDAATAAAHGAVDDLGGDDDLRARGTGVVQRLLAGAPRSVAGNRDALRRMARGTLTPTEAAEHETARAQAYASEDHAEARLAVAQRRAPRFSGR
jgi:enoyl-CoA hydratase/carnithine racemase